MLCLIHIIIMIPTLDRWVPTTLLVWVFMSDLVNTVLSMYCMSVCELVCSNPVLGLKHVTTPQQRVSDLQHCENVRTSKTGL